MPIVVQCSCGQEMTVRDDFAGRQLKCPGCGTGLVVPGPSRIGSSRALPQGWASPRRRSRPRPRKKANSPWPWLVVSALIVGAAVAAGVYVLPRPPKGGSTGAGSQTLSVPIHYADADVGDLARRLAAKQIAARTAAARSLAALGPRAREAVPALLAGMMRSSAGIEFEMAVAKAFKALGSAAVPQLVAALRVPDARTRFYAARALATVGPPAAPAVGALVAVLQRDPDYGVRGSAATALGGIGAAAASATAALHKAAGNPNTPFSGNPDRDGLRVAAQVALQKITEAQRQVGKDPF